MTDAGSCDLCGLSLTRGRVATDDGTFCCTGCRQVHEALDDVDGVDDETVRAAVERDGVEHDEPGGDTERSFVHVDGMHCATCEAFLESVATGADGVVDAEASYVTETVRVDHDPAVGADDLTDALSVAGYTARERDDEAAARRASEAAHGRMIAGVLLGMMVMLPYLVYIYPVHFTLLYPDWMLAMVRSQLRAARYFFYVLALFAGLVLVGVGAPLLRGAYVSLRTRQPNMDLLVSTAAVGAYVYSLVAVALGRIDVYFDVTVAIVVAVTAGTYYETRVKRSATALLTDLRTTRVEEARLYDGGDTRPVDVDELAGGDRVLVREGERVPVDGTLVDGECTVDEAVVTGESRPVTKAAGDEVVGGSVVAGGAAVVRVGEGATSAVDRVTDLVWDLQTAAGGIQGLADRLAVVFVPAVLVLAVVAAGAHLALGASPVGALLVGLTVLVVACPCALGLATPLAVASGVREAMETGLVVFDGTVFERLRDVEVVAFDKTGTLTTGEMTVRAVAAPEDILGAVAALERRAAHPAAAAIVEAVDGDGARADGGVVADRVDAGDAAATADDVDAFRSHATGVSGVVDGVELLAGHPELFADRGWELPTAVADRAAAAREAGHLPVVVGRDGTAEGVIVVGDEPREGWADAVADLADRGMEVVVLTGDEGGAADRFRRHDGVADVFAGVPPEAKAETVRRLGDGRQVAMVGDGSNDAPALAAADLGVAMGGGTALAADAADVAVVDDELATVPLAFDLAAAARRRVAQNVGWALVYNAVAVPLALTGHLNPLFAAAAMATSSLLVVTNSTRSLVEEESA